MTQRWNRACQSTLALVKRIRSMASALILAHSGGSASTSLTVRLLHGLTWQTFASLLGRIGSFAIALIQAHLLGKAGYGELGMVLSTLTLFGLFSSAVGGQTCTKFIAETRKVDSAVAEKITALSIVFTLIFSALAMVGILVCRTRLATQVLNAPQLSGLLLLAAVALSFQALSGTASGILLGLQEFRLEGNVRLVQIAAWLVLTPWMSLRWGTYGAMLAYTVSYAVGLAAYAAVTVNVCRRERFALCFRGMWAESRVLVEYSLPMMLYGLLLIPTVWICNAVLARQPGGYAYLGGYTAAVQFRTVVIQLPMLITSVVWPAMAEMWGTRQLDRLRTLYQDTFQVLWALGLLAALPMIAYGRIALRAFGRAFAADQQVLALVMIVAALYLLGNWAGLLLQAAGYVWTALSANVAYAAVSITCSLLLVPRYNAIGLAVAFVISFICLIMPTSAAWSLDALTRRGRRRRT